MSSNGHSDEAVEERSAELPVHFPCVTLPEILYGGRLSDTFIFIGSELQRC